MKKTIPQLVRQARAGQKLSMLTCYDATFARLLKKTELDLLLVGDSLGQVIQGHDSTLPVKLDEIIYHSKCVTRIELNIPVVADLPFLSYQASQTQAMLAAGRLLQEGNADAVKLEGGLEMAATVERMTAAGIPVMTHIGLRPQSIKTMGGYKIHGKTKASTQQLIEEALAFEQAGSFCVVLEGVATESAQEITAALSIPTIGIGSGPHCGGQVLVMQDLLGLNPDFSPRFVKHYANGANIVCESVQNFVNEVKNNVFPAKEHCFKRKTS